MLKRIQEARKTESGFTLIELLMVIVILGVLAGIVVFAVNGITDRGTVAACQSTKKTIQIAQEAHFAAKTAYAADIDALVNANFLHEAPPADAGFSTSSSGAVGATKCP